MQDRRPGEGTTGGGRGAVARFAPAAAVALDDLEAIVWRRVDVDLLDLTAHLFASIHGIPALARPAECGPSPWQGRDASEWRTFSELAASQEGALEFAEQFALDVSSVDDELRTTLVRSLGDKAAEFAQAVYVADVIPRARFVLDRIFGSSDRVATRSTSRLAADATVWNGIEEVIRVIPGLQGLDAVMTELVRLRGARAHQCRFCKSVRSRSAMVAGASDAMFEAVDNYRTSDLPNAVKAALAFTDTFIWTPGHFSQEEIADLTKHLSPAQQVELVLDIARNASNKFAVAMAADAANISEGYEVYDVKPDGSIEYGLTAP